MQEERTDLQQLAVGDVEALQAGKGEDARKAGGGSAGEAGAAAQAQLTQVSQRRQLAHQLICDVRTQQQRRSAIAHSDQI